MRPQGVGAAVSLGISMTQNPEITLQLEVRRLKALLSEIEKVAEIGLQDRSQHVLDMKRILLLTGKK